MSIPQSNMKFYIGAKGLKGNTPKPVKLFYRLLLAIAGAWLAIQPMFPEIGEHAAFMVTKIISAISIVSYFVGQAMGWVKEDSSTEIVNQDNRDLNDNKA